MSELLWIKLISLGLVLLVTLLGGLYPFIHKFRASVHAQEYPAAEALAAGIFLGAGLIHMLGDASKHFNALGIEYPIAFLLAGMMFLLLLWFEHLGRDYYEHEGSHSRSFAILAVVLLSIHSLLAGTALGLSSSYSVLIIILIAILAHKWAASFALAVYLNRSDLSFSKALAWFALFALMVPTGVIAGTYIESKLGDIPLLEPIFNALAAGTFLYLGTLHGLKQAIMVEKCCNLRNYSFVILGFSLMSVVAIWT